MMGRKRIHTTEEARVAAVRASKAKTKNITVDADLVEILGKKADELADVFGFRPTLSQTVRHLIRNSEGK